MSYILQLLHFCGCNTITNPYASDYSISVLRFIDFVMMGLTALLSISLGITITAGLNATCNKKANDDE